MPSIYKNAIHLKNISWKYVKRKHMQFDPKQGQ